MSQLFIFLLNLNENLFCVLKVASFIIFSFSLFLKKIGTKKKDGEQKQNLYGEFHSNVMQYRGRINKDVLLNIAKKIGLNIDKLNEDLKSDDIKFIIQKNKELAQRLNINGTPSFVIGKKVYPGALSEEQFVKLIKEERNNTY